MAVETEDLNLGLDSCSSAALGDAEISLLSLLREKEILTGGRFINRGETRLFTLTVFIAILRGLEVICVNLTCSFYIFSQNPVSVLVNVLSRY